MQYLETLLEKEENENSQGYGEVGFLLDNSGSTAGFDREFKNSILLHYVKDTVPALGDGQFRRIIREYVNNGTISMHSFNDSVIKEIRPADMLEYPRPDGGTNTFQAILQLIQKRQREQEQGMPWTIVLVTDGQTSHADAECGPHVRALLEAHPYIRMRIIYMPPPLVRDETKRLIEQDLASDENVTNLMNLPGFKLFTGFFGNNMSNGGMCMHFLSQVMPHGFDVITATADGTPDFHNIDLASGMDREPLCGYSVPHCLLQPDADTLLLGAMKGQLGEDTWCRDVVDYVVSRLNGDQEETALGYLEDLALLCITSGQNHFALYNEMESRIIEPLWHKVVECRDLTDTDVKYFKTFKNSVVRFQKQRLAAVLETDNSHDGTGSFAEIVSQKNRKVATKAADEHLRANGLDAAQTSGPGQYALLLASSRDGNINFVPFAMFCDDDVVKLGDAVKLGGRLEEYGVKCSLLQIFNEDGEILRQRGGYLHTNLYTRDVISDAFKTHISSVLADHPDGSFEKGVYRYMQKDGQKNLKMSTDAICVVIDLYLKLYAQAAVQAIEAEAGKMCLECMKQILLCMLSAPQLSITQDDTTIPSVHDRAMYCIKNNSRFDLGMLRDTPIGKYLEAYWQEFSDTDHTSALLAKLFDHPALCTSEEHAAFARLAKQSRYISSPRVGVTSKCGQPYRYEDTISFDTIEGEVWELAVECHISGHTPAGDPILTQRFLGDHYVSTGTKNNLLTPMPGYAFAKHPYTRETLTEDFFRLVSTPDNNESNARLLSLSETLASINTASTNKTVDDTVQTQTLLSEWGIPKSVHITGNMVPSFATRTNEEAGAIAQKAVAEAAKQQQKREKAAELARANAEKTASFVSDFVNKSTFQIKVEECINDGMRSYRVPFNLEESITIHPDGSTAEEIHATMSKSPASEQLIFVCDDPSDAAGLEQKIIRDVPGMQHSQPITDVFRFLRTRTDNFNNAPVPRVISINRVEQLNGPWGHGREGPRVNTMKWKECLIRFPKCHFMLYDTFKNWIRWELNGELSKYQDALKGHNTTKATARANITVQATPPEAALWEAAPPEAASPVGNLIERIQALEITLGVIPGGQVIKRMSILEDLILDPNVKYVNDTFIGRVTRLEKELGM